MIERLVQLLCSCRGVRRRAATKTRSGEGEDGDGDGAPVNFALSATASDGVNESRLPHKAQSPAHAPENEEAQKPNYEDGLYSGIPTLSDEPVAMYPEELAKHERFMREALAQAEYALTHDETPVGCVFVRNGKVIGRGMNDTNRSLNGTRHAEFVAIAEILKTYDTTIFKETDLYVTVEPCIMCASALRQYGIRAVYFGCANDRFGGTSGVLNINSDPSVDPPYPALGGIFREEAIMLLRRFYIQENGKAPVPHKKNRVLKEDIPPPKEGKNAIPSAIQPQRIMPVVPLVPVSPRPVSKSLGPPTTALTPVAAAPLVPATPLVTTS